MYTGVLLYPQFSEYEISVALSVLMQGKKPIKTIGLTLDAVTGESGLTCKPDLSIADADAGRIDSLLLPGCFDISTLTEAEELFQYVKTVVHHDTKIFAISSSPFILAKAGLLENKTYTVGLLREDRDVLGVFDEKNYREELVVQDGNLVTARGRAFVEFGIMVGQLLNVSFDSQWYNKSV